MASQDFDPSEVVLEVSVPADVWSGTRTFLLASLPAADLPEGNGRISAFSQLPSHQTPRQR